MTSAPASDSARAARTLSLAYTSQAPCLQVGIDLSTTWISYCGSVGFIKSTRVAKWDGFWRHLAQTQGAAAMTAGRKASVMLLVKAMTTGWFKGSLKTFSGADRMYVCSKLWPAKSVAMTVYSMFGILAASLKGLHCRHLPKLLRRICLQM